MKTPIPEPTFVFTASALAARDRQHAEELARMKASRDAWKAAACSSGVCEACGGGCNDPMGCTDCMNTGWDQGYDPIEHVKELIDLLKAYRGHVICRESVDLLDSSAHGTTITPEQIAEIRCLCQDNSHSGENQ